MDGRLMSSPFMSSEQQDQLEYYESPENSGESPRSTSFTHHHHHHDTKINSFSSPKKSRRGIQKRVVSVPIRDVEGSRLKGETSAPPSDSWAWRKYGQKPIKGSPYPRGYYRCSSSKGCPARKQVERSRSDPSTLVVTYSHDHNHPWPPSKSKSTAAATATTTTVAENATVPAADSEQAKGKLSLSVFSTNQLPDPEQDDKFSVLTDETLIVGGDQFGWFPEVLETTSSSSYALLDEGPNLVAGGGVCGDTDGMGLMFSTGEDELLFADLGELPEYSVVFRGGHTLEREEERRRCGLTPFCGTTL